MGKSKWITPRIKQWWCASSVLICNAGQGMMLGYTACLLPALQAEDSPIEVDIGMATWLASIMGPSVLVGTIASCILMDWFGRRTSHIISIIPGIFGWAMIYLAESYLVIFIGRILTSATAGAVCTVGTFVIGEYTSPQRRGMFLNLKTTGVSIGATLSHILSNFIHWRMLALVALIPNVISLAMTFTWPESPSWLASKKYFDKCKKEFFWLREINEKSVREVSELIESQKERISRPKIEKTVRIKDFFRKFTMQDFLKPLIVCVVAFVVMEASGRHYFPAYALQILNDSVNSETPVHYYTLCIDIIFTVTTVVASVLIKLIKVRTLLFTSGIGASIVLVFLCIILFLTSIGVISSYPWLITSLFILYFAFGNLGCIPIPIVLQGELIPLAHKETATSILGVTLCFTLTVIMKAVPYMLLALKVYGTLAVFGVITAISLLILYFTLPETKDKTLQEIENFIVYGKYRINDEPVEMYDKMLVKDDKNATKNEMINDLF